MASDIHKRLAAEGGGMQVQPKEAKAQSAKINSAPLWLGGEKQTQEASNCCWAGEITPWWHDCNDVYAVQKRERPVVSNTTTSFNSVIVRFGENTLLLN